MNKRLVGIYGEDLAAKYLKKVGYKIIERNFRIRGGEIDIIATDNDTLVYIEVKTRTSNNFGIGEESVNFYKLKFLERAAKFYRLQRKNLPQQERIDVIAIDLSEPHPQINLIKNAGQQ
jgi:putative endonuclease